MCGLAMCLLVFCSCLVVLASVLFVVVVVCASLLLRHGVGVLLGASYLCIFSRVWLVVILYYRPFCCVVLFWRYDASGNQDAFDCFPSHFTVRICRCVSISIALLYSLLRMGTVRSVSGYPKVFLLMCA